MTIYRPLGLNLRLKIGYFSTYFEPSCSSCTNTRAVTRPSPLATSLRFPNPKKLKIKKIKVQRADEFLKNKLKLKGPIFCNQKKFREDYFPGS
jgi:hypothetical protein